MAAYTFRAAGTFAGASSGTLSPGAPAGKTAGDLLLLCSGARGNTDVAPTVTGYTLLIDTSSTTVDSLAIWGRIADGSATDTPTLDWVGTNNSAAQIAAFNGDVYTDLATIIAHSSVAGTTGATANIPNPALTITTDNCLVIGAGKKTKTSVSDGATATSPSGLANRLGFKWDNGASQIGLVWDYTIQTTATNIAASIWDQSIEESLAYASIVVALQTASLDPIRLVWRM